MLSPVFFNRIEQAVSQERMDNHRIRGETDTDALARYIWNISLCEAMYPALQNLEVALRNTIHFAAANEYGTNFWFEDSAGILRFQELQRVAEAKDSLRRQSKPLTAGHVVAELSFGFWTNLLDRRYDGVLWPRLLNAAFPYVPRTLKQRRKLLNHFDPLRDLRNKVFHHRAIWRLPNLIDLHKEAIEAIGWISPELKTLTLTIDRFPQVHGQGLRHYKTLLQGIK